MSFFRNIRTSIKSRGKSSSRDTTPVRGTTTISSSRPGSVMSNATAGRRDSMDSRTDSLFNRSDTFILDGSDHEDKNHSNTSTLEKKSKKSKVLSKFSTFTKRKKTPSPAPGAYEHHPSDHATNTYYNWKSETPSNLDYDSQTDPFNFLYEQHSSLKSLQNGSSGGSASSNLDSPRAEMRGSNSSSSATYDSSTYRKGKMPTQLKEQLEQLKTQSSRDLHEEEPESESEKFKTITLNSFRKSFRDKFLQQQKDAPYNPAWFVEVEKPATPTPTEKLRMRNDSKENRPDFLVFENDNYRPESRSPVRELTERRPRSSTRSPVKRNETFRVERPSVDRTGSVAHSQQPAIYRGETTAHAPQPSIRIEFKNSITPNIPGRMVPVGVAKPMPSTQYSADYYQQQQQQQHTLSTPTKSTTRISRSPLRNWFKSSSATSPARNSSTVNSSGRYQTLVQIRNESNAAPPPKPSMIPAVASNRNRQSTRIQFTGAASPMTQKRSSSSTITTRYSTTPLQHIPAALSSYELLKNSTPLLSGKATQKPYASSSQLGKPKKQHHTYFGDYTQVHPPTTTPTMTATNTTTAYTRLPSALSTTNSRTLASSGAFGGSHSTPATGKYYQPQQQQQSRSAAVSSGGGGGGGGGIYLNRREQQPQYQQLQPQRLVVPVQRRSRSPIKMPWR